MFTKPSLDKRLELPWRVYLTLSKQEIKICVQAYQTLSKQEIKITIWRVYQTLSKQEIKITITKWVQINIGNHGRYWINFYLGLAG